MITISLVDNKTYLHAEQPKELTKLPHTISMLNTDNFIPTEKYEQLPEIVFQHNFALRPTLYMQKFTTKFTLPILNFADIFQCETERIPIFRSEEEENVEIPPETENEIPQEEQQAPEVESREHKEILKFYLQILQKFLLEIGVELKKINFVGVKTEKIECFREVFGEFELDFISVFEADLASFVVKNEIYSKQKILFFSFKNEFPCYKHVCVDINSVTESNVLPFISFSENTYFDPKMKMSFKDLIQFDSDGKQTVPDGYKSLKFRKSIKDGFREQIKQIIRQQEEDVKFVVCDELFISNFEQYREPSRERVLFDVRTTCETWNFNLQFKMLESFDLKVIPVFQRMKIIKEAPSFVKEQTARFLFKQFYPESKTLNSIECRKQLNDSVLNPSTSLITAKITSEKDLDKILLEIFSFANKIKLDLTEQVNIQIALGDNFLKTLRSELQDEFVEEEEEKEEEVQEQQEEEQKEEEKQPEEETNQGEENKEEEQVEQEKEEEKIETPPVQPKKVNHLRLLLKNISQNLASLQTKKIQKLRIKQTQQDLLICVSGQNIQIVQNISARLTGFIKLIGGIASEVFTLKAAPLVGPFIFCIDFVALKNSCKFQIKNVQDQQKYEQFNIIQMNYQNNSRNHSGQFVIFQSENCKNFKQVEKNLKQEVDIISSSIVLTASYFMIVSEELAHILVNPIDPEEFEEVDDAEEPEEVEEEPEEEKFGGEEEKKEGEEIADKQAEQEPEE